MLREPALETYLSATRSNKVVITELLAIEMNKKAAVRSAPDYYRILCRYSAQVLILRNSYEWHNERIRSAIKARSLICSEQTTYFPDFCRSVYEHPQDPRFVAHLEKEEESAKWYMNQLNEQSRHQEKVFATIAERFSVSERAELISRVFFSQPTVAKILDLVNFATIQLLDDAEISQRFRPRNMFEAMNTYLFRYALCIILLYTRWMVGGGKPTGKRVDRITNDVIDMQIVATSTFFGGLLSHDHKPADVSKEARRLLRGIKAFVG